MSIIPASLLDPSDLALLGNNLTRMQPTGRKIRRRRAQLRAVNRSLSSVGEQVKRLHDPAHRRIDRLIHQPA